MRFKKRKLVLAILAASVINLACSPSLLNAAPVSFPLQTNIDSDKISFYFQDIELRTLLQLIAKNSHLNFIISDAVKGNTTLDLKNVTWQQALDIVMKSHGLTARRVGNVMYISTIEEITSNESKKLQSDQTLSNLAPIESSIIQLKYANAKDLAEFLKGQNSSLLTARGQVAVDVRTNSLIIRDIYTNLEDLTKAIHRLDVPAKQVLIEARIVTIDTNYEEQLGVKFGIGNNSHLSGTLAGANEVANGVPLSLVPIADRLNFNNPATQLASGANPGSIAIALAKIGGVLVDLELSAIEEEGHGQIIASPHVITSNLQKATIETGEEIPYQEATSSGATSISFKKAVLSLQITPQITPNNKIILHLKATQDSRGQQLQISAGSTAGAPPVLGPPIINSQGVESQVLLNNNETIVIGGIYKQTKLNTVDRIPFLGSIPVVGYLFRQTKIKNARSELLIFVTPKIINPIATADNQTVKTFVYKQ
jgi:type IV pilus assembly protein PilQ